MTAPLPRAEAGTSFSASAVTRVVRHLLRRTKGETRRQWLTAVSRRTTAERPDLHDALVDLLGVEPEGEDVLAGLTIGEVGLCYEALLASLDRGRRRDSGQYFTPDDAAAFMTAHATDFPTGHWLDPCSGVGNLSWHLAAGQSDPAVFVREHLTLIDKDETALLTAVAILAADFAGRGDAEAVSALQHRSQVRDFLSRDPLPAFDYAILNPPYARAPQKAGYRTGSTRDLFAYFLERIASNAQGFIAVTPASYLSIPKFQPLRDHLDRTSAGGRIYVFDNVPDTLFRGYKFGSHNTSKTNFVRAAITVVTPCATEWLLTPILRWTTESRSQMFARCHEFLSPRRVGPHGEWAKLPSPLHPTWEFLTGIDLTLADLVTEEESPFRLTVATTPRYYISATTRPLDRSSKAVLHFRTAGDRDHASIVLNSSLPYLWWRVLDGGVSLPRRVLMSVPIPELPADHADLIARISESENRHVVTKLNAGRQNENVKHPPELVALLNDALIPGAGEHLGVIYSQNMFPLTSEAAS